MLFRTAIFSFADAKIPFFVEKRLCKVFFIIKNNIARKAHTLPDKNLVHKSKSFFNRIGSTAENRTNPGHIELRSAVIIVNTVLFLFHVRQLRITIPPHLRMVVEHRLHLSFQTSIKCVKRPGGIAISPRLLIVVIHLLLLVSSHLIPPNSSTKNGILPSYSGKI